MKKRLKKFFRNLRIVISLIFNKIKHKIQGYQMTEKGKASIRIFNKSNS